MLECCIDLMIYNLTTRRAPIATEVKKSIKVRATMKRVSKEDGLTKFECIPGGGGRAGSSAKSV
ncbi:hypothetical protein MMC22_002526 [Lobaria immixta]|nr:hypothetical protein [Lobaria immixta]